MAGLYRWEAASMKEHNIPLDTWKVGRDVDGADIYVAKARHEQEVMPAKVVPTMNQCSITYNQGFIPKNEYEALVPNVFRWEYHSKGEVPPNAVEAGTSSTGQMLYFGRVNHNGQILPAKIHPAHGGCFFAVGDKELSSTEYEVLVLNSVEDNTEVPCKT